MRRSKVAAFLIAMLLAGLGLLAARPSQADPSPADLVKVDLVAEPLAVKPGEPFWLGIRLAMREHWHTYWRNPGDSGLATEVAWTLPPGFAAGGVVWPAPAYIRVGPLANFGYEGEAVLLVQVTPPADLEQGARLALAAKVSYLVCERICIPGEAEVATEVGVARPGGPARRNPAVASAFEAARAALPTPSPWPVRFAADEKTLRLGFGNGAISPERVRSATFLPHADTLIENAAPQVLAGTGDGLSLAIRRSNLGAAVPERVDGVLLVEEDIGGSVARHAFAVEAVPGPVAAALPPAVAADRTTLLGAVVLALLGGLILNLMPCVFPVLSIKILHLTRHAGETPARVRLHGLAYTAGILASFVLLAGLLFAVRAAGDEVGWGFQLQSPAFVAVLAYVLFALGLSLSGAVQLGGLANVGSGLAARHGLQGSFFTGVLATVVATPCTAPFMGSAVGFAMTQHPAVGLAVFLALGVGLALPFLALSLVPGLQRRLPRPGAWMETLKQLLAFPLYATVAWLVWVLSQQVGPTGLFAALLGLVLVAFAAWALTLAQGSRTGPRRLSLAAVAAAVVALVLVVRTVGSEAASSNPGTAALVGTAETEAGTEPFSQQRLDALLAERRPVFVNMTAAWCITCLVNERTTLSTDAVRAAFRDGKIAYLKGDWTNRNPEITRVLERHGRSGVPLYLFYPAGKDPIVLPQILTESVVLEHTGRL